MLDVLRRNAGSWVIKVILGFIALTFVSWGVFVGFSDQTQSAAATVGKEKISMAALDQAANAIEKSYRDVYGPAFTPEMQKALRIKDQALDSLIQKALLLEDARKMGLTASDTEVQREIAATPSFQEDGQFREDRYRSLLTYNRISPSEYEEQKREEITLRKFEGLFHAAGRIPESEGRDRFETLNRKIRLLVAVADPSALRNVPPPTESEIGARYATDKEQFRIPARVKLLVARFEPARFGGDAAPPEAEIRKFYEANTDKFRTDEERFVSRIVLPYTAKTKDNAQKKAAGMLAEAGKSKSAFDALAKKSGGKSGELTLKRKGSGPASVVEAVFGGQVDSVVGPIDAGDSIQIVRINRIKFPEPLPLAQVHDQVVALLRTEKGKDVVVVKAYEARGKATTSKDLKAVATGYGIPTAETGWLGDKETGGLPPAVVQEALMQPLHEVGPVKSVGDVHYLFQVAAKEDSRVPALAELRDRLSALVTADKRHVAAVAAARKVASGAKSAADLERIAKAEGLSVSTTPFFTPLSGTLPEMLKGIPAKDRKSLAMLTPKSPVVSGAIEAGARTMAVAFIDEQPADPNEWASRKEAFLRDLEEKRRTELLEAYVTARYKDAKVKKNPDALK
ncbi:MAG TPA: SurA N-terminal domain-containing protein [Candidatus Deferrimicrobiaceae bacterium]|jgi:peptidyl-prolyl cis-trans isomerase D